MMEKLCKSDAKKLDTMIASSSRTVIVTHTHPDGDAIGSCVAMKSFIDNRYKTPSSSIVLSNRENCSVSFLFDNDSDRLYAEEDMTAVSAAIGSSDLIICLDFNTLSRTGALEDLLMNANTPKVLFDHHLNPDNTAFDFIISSTEVSSTCEILYNSLKTMPGIGGKAANLPIKCLTGIMTGITTDTNNFANSVFPGTLSATSELLAAGVDREAILMHTFNEYRENRFRLMGHLLAEELKITALGVAYMVLPDEIANKYDIKDGELEGFVNIPLGIKSVRISIFVREDDGFLRVSIRSKRGTSANELACRYFHGGGHVLASGGKLYCPQDVADIKEAAAYIEKVTEDFFDGQEYHT